MDYYEMLVSTHLNGTIQFEMRTTTSRTGKIGYRKFGPIQLDINEKVQLSKFIRQRAYEALKTGMHALEKGTCLRFVEQTNEEDYLDFYKGSGCWSYIGRLGGMQNVSLDTGCWNERTVAHEVCCSADCYLKH